MCPPSFAPTRFGPLLVCCLLVIFIDAAASFEYGAQQANQESILRDQVLDLKRLSSIQNEQQQQPDQLASANQQSFVLDDTSALLPQLMMMASGSAPLPQGRRRLDDSTGLLTLSTDRRPFNALTNQFNAGGQTPLEARTRAIMAGRSQYENIVDNGANAKFSANSIPHSALVAMMTNNNFNRMAMASAMRSQQAQVEQASARRRQHQSEQAQRLMQQQRSKAAKAAPSSKGAAGRLQESKLVNNKRRKPAEKLNEFTRGGGGDDDDELNSSGSSNSGDYDEDDADEQDDERASPKKGASRRQSKDDIFNELDDDATNSDEGDSDEGSAAAAPVAKRSRQQRLKQAASRQYPNKRRHQAGTKRQTSSSDSDEGQQDEDIDSTNTRQMTRRPELPAPVESPIKAKVSGDNGNRRSNQLRRRAVKAPEEASNVGDQLEADNKVQSQQDQQQLGADDDLSAASYVRNTATDLQTAAGKHYGGHHYHQMVEVPKKKAYKMSFKRGNHKHEISKHEKLHKHKFHTKFMWHAKEKCKKKKKCKSVGKMTWEYKHDKKHHHH